MIAFLDLLDTEYEKEQFTELYNKYSNLLYKIAFNKVNNVHDAEDCVQDTFLYIAKNFYKIEDINSTKTKYFLSTIVSSIAIDRFRRSKKIEFISLDDYEKYEDLSYIDNYEPNEISFCIDKLDDDSKNLIYLTYYFGYKSKEIAEMLGVKNDAIKQRLCRARKKLKKIIEEGE